MNDTTCKYKSKQHEIISFLHRNISSPSFHFDELCALLIKLNHSPDIIAISESCLKSSTQSIVNCVEHTPTGCSNGDTLLYIKNDISCKLRNDLKIYKSKECLVNFHRNN